MKTLYKNESFSFFIKLYDKRTNQLCKIDARDTIIFGIKVKKDVFSNKEYVLKRKITNSDFIDGEGFLVFLSPEETNFDKRVYYYDIGLQYFDHNDKTQFKLLKNTEKILVEGTVTKIYKKPTFTIGIEADFENNIIERIGDSLEWIPGDDFDRLECYGLRRRCNVNSNGSIICFNGEDDTIIDESVTLTNGVLSDNGSTVSSSTTNLVTDYIPLTNFIKRGLYTKIIQSDDTIKWKHKIWFYDSNYNCTYIGYPYSNASKDKVHYSPVGQIFRLKNYSYIRICFAKISGEEVEPNEISKVELYNTSYIDTCDYDESVMIYQPAFYYKTEIINSFNSIRTTDRKIATKVRYFISNAPKKGFKLHPAFYDDDGKPIEYILLSAYECSVGTSTGYYEPGFRNSGGNRYNWTSTSNRLCSTAGILSSTNFGGGLYDSDWEMMANYRGSHWHARDIKAYMASIWLFMIEYASFDAKTSIGLGYINPTVDWPYLISARSGSTSFLGNKTGIATISSGGNGIRNTSYSSNGYTCASYRGEENLWGDLNQLCSGITIAKDNESTDDGIVYIADNHACSYTSLSSQTATKLPLPYTQYFKYVGYDSDYDWCILPADDIEYTSGPTNLFNSGNSMKLNDKNNSSYPCYVLYTRQLEVGSGAGLFHFWDIMSANFSDNGRRMYTGTRMMFIPTAVE